MPIDYERMKRTFPKHKAALTRATKKGYPAVLKACRAAVNEWNEIGAWPDDWALWNRVLGDAAFAEARETGAQPQIFRLDEV